MRITLLNRKEEDHLGGDMIQLREYEKVLKKLGHVVDYQWGLKPDLSKTDEVFMFHCQFGWNNRQYQEIKRVGIPYRVFAIFYPGVYSDNDVFTVKAILEGAKAIYCLSEKEKNEMISEVELSQNAIDKIDIIPNGVDKNIFYDERLERKYVMTAGRYDKTKGHLLVAKICKELGLPFITVGPVWDREEKDSCSRSATGDCIISEEVSQRDLNILYNKAKVYVCASGSERNNLCVLEAAATGASIVNSTLNRGYIWLDAPAINPYNRESLKEEILRSYNNPKDYSSEIVSWDKVIKLILK